MTTHDASPNERRMSDGQSVVILLFRCDWSTCAENENEHKCDEVLCICIRMWYAQLPLRYACAMWCHVFLP